jgi:hypothetical protein
MGIAQEIKSIGPRTAYQSLEASQLVFVLPIHNHTNDANRHPHVVLLQRMTQYLREEVLMDDGYAHVMDRCINQNASCVEWATQDECRINHDYMTAHCRLACQRCHYDSKYVSLF